MAATMRLRQEHLDAMIAHARAEMPNECCGVIAELDGTITALHPARNADASPYRFTIDPMETKAIEEAIDQSGARLGGFYHSHPNGPPRPSETDIRAMSPFFGPPYVHFIISLADPGAPVVRMFHIYPDRTEEQEYALVADPA